MGKVWCVTAQQLTAHAHSWPGSSFLTFQKENVTNQERMPWNRIVSKWPTTSSKRKKEVAAIRQSFLYFPFQIDQCHSNLLANKNYSTTIQQAVWDATIRTHVQPTSESDCVSAIQHFLQIGLCAAVVKSFVSGCDTQETEWMAMEQESDKNWSQMTKWNFPSVLHTESYAPNAEKTP